EGRRARDEAPRGGLRGPGAPEQRGSRDRHGRRPGGQPAVRREQGAGGGQDYIKEQGELVAAQAQPGAPQQRQRQRQREGVQGQLLGREEAVQVEELVRRGRQRHRKSAGGEQRAVPGVGFL